MVGYVGCLTEIRNATGLKDMTDEEAGHFLDSVLATANRLRGERAISHDEALAAAAKELAEQQSAVAARKKLNAMLDLSKRVSRRGRIVSQGADKVYDGIRAELHGINTPRPGTPWRRGVEQDHHGLAKQWVSAGVMADLDRAGLAKAAANGTIDGKIADEIWELNKGADRNPGVSGSPEALKIAKIYQRWLNTARVAMNREGAWIGEAPDYVAHTSHNGDKIYGKGRAIDKDTWVNAVLPKLDARTFDGITETPYAFLSKVWDNLVTGVHMTPDGMTGFKGPAFAGPGNMARHLSEARVLRWKDAASWLEYQKQYGEPHLGAAVLHSLDHSARATALMQRYGTNPEIEFANDLRWLKEKYVHSDPSAAIEIGKKERALQNRFGQVTGRDNIPANRTWARIGRLVRLDESLSKLGNVMFTHLNVGMTHAAEARHHGIGLPESYGNFLKSAVMGRGQGERREMANLLGAGADGATEHILNRFDLDNGFTGAASSLSNAFFRMTGIRYLFNAERGGFEMMMSHNLGANLDKTFGDLHPGLQNLLGGYGIEGKEWDLLRNAAERTTANGRVYLTPHDAMRISDANARAYLTAGGHDGTAREIDALRHDLALRVNAYIDNSAQRGMVQPGAETHAILSQGMRPGTPGGEIARFLAQFKVWPTELIRSGLGREVFTSKTWKGAAVGISHMIAAGTIFGYLRNVAADIAAGKEPRDPTQWATVLAALAQGGGMGLAGDFLFGQGAQSRFGQGPLVSLLGPGAEDANSLYDMLIAAKNLKGGQVATQALNFATSHIPFANLFYARAALEYLVLWRLNEMVNPGWAQRYEHQVQQQNGQRFWLSPAATVGQ